MKHTARTYSVVAGILYLTTHVTSVLAVVAYRNALDRWGALLEFALAIACVGTGVLLWALLKDVGPVRAATFALLRTVEAAVIIAGILAMVARQWMAGPGESAGGVLEGLHSASFLLGQGLVISVNTIVLGWLLLASRRVPRALGGLGVVGGVLVLSSNVSQLMGAIPLNGVIAGVCAAPVFAFEIWLALHLIFRGLRTTATPAVPASASA